VRYDADMSADYVGREVAESSPLPIELRAIFWDYAFDAPAGTTGLHDDSAFGDHHRRPLPPQLLGPIVLGAFR